MDKLIERLDRIDPESLQTHFLRLARERGLLETVFQSIQEGVLVVDADGRLEYANRAAEQYLGFSAATARGRPVSRWLGDIDWDRVTRLDEGEWSRLMTREIEITYPVRRILTFYVVPLARRKDEPRGGVLVMLRDVTRDREQEASLLESERLNAVKLLAAGVAHEIGNPLNALTIHLQLLDREIRALQENADPSWQAELGELHDLTGVARNEVARLDVIITQFLRAIRPQPPQCAPARLDKLLEETLILLRQEVENRNIDIEIERPDHVPRVKVDRDQVKQAFFNLIRNAFQAMPDGGHLRIVLFTTDEDIGVAFQDTGVGIRPEDFGRIFEPYHTTKTGGSGLGLMIVQRIVQDHGGQIEVSSKPGEGTRFTLYLPRVERRTRLLEARGRPAAGPAGGAAARDVAEHEVHDDGE